MGIAPRGGLEHGGDAGSGSQQRAVSDPTPDFNQDLPPSHLSRARLGRDAGPGVPERPSS